MRYASPSLLCPHFGFSTVAHIDHADLLQGGFHELQNEPDGVQEKLVEECIAWIEAHIPNAASAPTTTDVEARASKL